jgi:hypothetical protein
MGKDELDVFLSSDQMEFNKLRNKLSIEICNIPFLTCKLLEQTGADSSTVLDASLKAVRGCDIYVGIFGHDYSEITIKEYQEAVRFRKPCLTYVKKLRKRDERLIKFINDVLKNDFKFFVFSRNKDLICQLNIDLLRFILETLKRGLEQRASQKGKMINLISKEEKFAPKAVQTKDPLAEVEASYQEGKYLECLILTVAIIETRLRKILNIYSRPSKSLALGSLISEMQKLGLFNSREIDFLRRISIYRNDAIHFGTIPDKKTIQEVLEIAQHMMRVFSRIDVKGRKTSKKDTALWKPLPKIDYRIAQRLLRTLHFPQVGWEAYNNSPYQLRVSIAIHPILGGKDLHPLPDNDINGTNVYEVEPNSYLFANGCFTLPHECARSNKELILEIHTTVEDINDPEKGEHKLLPKRWKYVRERNSWSYYPQKGRT